MDVISIHKLILGSQPSESQQDTYLNSSKYVSIPNQRALHEPDAVEALQAVFILGLAGVWREPGEDYSKKLILYVASEALKAALYHHINDITRAFVISLKEKIKDIECRRKPALELQALTNCLSVIVRPNRPSWTDGSWVAVGYSTPL